MKKTPSKTIDELRLIDDEMFRLASSDKKFCQELINTLTNLNITVIKAEPQAVMVGLHREAVLDVLCESTSGNLVNCEVQIKHKHDDMRRCRYHAAAILVNNTPKNSEFADIPNIKIIYITTYDALGNGQAVTSIRRCQSVAGDFVEVDDGEEIIFANTAVKDDTKESKLLQLFLETDVQSSEDFPAISDRFHYLKHTEKGREEMSDAVLEYAKEYAREYARESNAEAALTSAVSACILLCKKFNQTKEDAIDAVASLNDGVPRQKITELVSQKW